MRLSFLSLLHFLFIVISIFHFHFSKGQVCVHLYISALDTFDVVPQRDFFLSFKHVLFQTASISQNRTSYFSDVQEQIFKCTISKTNKNSVLFSKVSLYSLELARML